MQHHLRWVWTSLRQNLNSFFLSVSTIFKHTPALHCCLCHPLTPHRPKVIADTKEGVQHMVVNGVTEGGGWGVGGQRKEERRKMRVMTLKLAFCEKVTDDLMHVVNSPHHRNQAKLNFLSSLIHLSSTFYKMLAFWAPESFFSLFFFPENDTFSQCNEEAHPWIKLLCQTVHRPFPVPLTTYTNTHISLSLNHLPEQRSFLKGSYILV